MKTISVIRNKILQGTAICLSAVLFSPGIAVASQSTDSVNEGISKELTTLFRSARGVISKNQKHINNADIGDKGLSGDAVVAKAKENYKAATGSDFTIGEGTKGESQQAMLQAIIDTMNEAQPLINEQGKGFKGFLPAIFARQVATKFSDNMEGKAVIKLTAPKSYVRNRKNRPDDWENSIIEDKFKDAGYEKGKPFLENTTHKGKQAFRYILPEYYNESCLSCHGGTKGDRDITGGKMEGGKLGELGGAISLVLYNR